MHNIRQWNLSTDTTTSINWLSTMDASKIPVTYDFFKKYTYHEECIDFLFKSKAKGNQKIYDALRNSPEYRENALKSYYKAFYLKPQIREKYHIRLKAVPKKIKDKLLQIPVQDTITQTNVHSKSNENIILQVSPMQELVNSDQNGNAKTGEQEMLNSRNIGNKINPKLKQLLAQDAEINDQEIEDDKELHEEEEKTNLESINKSLEQQTNKKETLQTSLSNPKKSFVERQITSEIPITEQQSNTKVTPEVNLKTNENMLQQDIGEPNGQQSNAKESQTVDQGKSSVNYKDLIPYIHCCPLTYKEFRKYSNINQLVYEFCKKKQLNISEERKILNRSYILFYLAPEHRTTTPINKIQLLENCPAHIRDKFFNIPTNLYLKEEVKKKQEENVMITRALIKPPDDTNACENIPPAQEQNTSFSMSNNDQSLPISLEEFKIYTYYDEVIDNLFKSVAQGNENIYWKYKNSQEALNVTLENYYRAFYLIPVVREIFPIQFKPTPKSLKCRLLQIPKEVDATAFANIRAEQLVFPKLEEENDMAEQKLIAVAATNFNNCFTAKTQLVATEKAAEGTYSVGTETKSFPQANSKSSIASGSYSPAKSQLPNEQNSNKTHTQPVTAGTKRSPKNDIEQPSPKRLKEQLEKEQTEAFTENCEKTKKRCKELLHYAHCCPVTFSQFKKYTNITELFTRHCQSRYKDLKKLPYIVKKAYILHYLAPENRKLRPFNKLKLTDDCPQHIKEKIFEIPTNLYELEETQQIPNLPLKKEINSEYQQLPEQQIAVRNNPKATIEILENRLLPPTTLNLSNYNASTECTPLSSSIYCLNTNCVFHFISHHDFMKQTNILQILPQPQDINVIKNFFKKFIHKIIKENNCDDIYVHGNLLSKILKHQHICEKCESDIIDLINKDTAEDCRESVINQNTIGNSSCNNQRSQGVEINAVQLRREQEVNRRLTIKEKDILPTYTPDPENASKTRPQKLSKELIKVLKREKTFQKFRQKLLTKLCHNINNNNNTADFSSDTYNIFLQCNEIPLRKILNDFCPTHEDIKDRILNDKELCQVLQRYYYYKYLTIKNFAIKYPVYIRDLEKENSNDANDHNMETKEVEIRDTVTETNSKDAGKLKESENLKELADSKALEKAKRIFFRNVEKTNTLSYVVRTSFGLKHWILRKILSMSYEEFLRLTKIYEGQSLYNDSHIAECMYRFVFRTPTVWPTNLYITLQHLCNFLYEKKIRFNNYTTMLIYISPKLLHWSDLRSCTTIEKSVKLYYEKRTGKKFDPNDETLIAYECNEYYNRCWQYDKWLESVPLLYTNSYRNYVGNSKHADVTKLSESALQENNLQLAQCTDKVCTIQHMNVVSSSQQQHSEQTEVAVQNTNTEIVPDYVLEVNIETTDEQNTSSSANRSIKEFNCILLPNTQQQINMLPAEVGVTKDPLTNSFADTNLNESSPSNENNEIRSLSEIKTEPIKEKLLTNLFFYEDDDSNIQCVPCEEEVVILDDTISPLCDNLPPSQLHFDEVVPEQILSDDLVASDNSTSALNLAQRLPSSIESNDSSNLQLRNISAITSTQNIQLLDVSLGSSGENGSQQQQQQHIEHSNEIEQHLEQLIGEEVMNIESSPNTIAELSSILQNIQSSSESTDSAKHTQLFPSCLENIPSCSTDNSLKILQNNLEIEQQANNVQSLAAALPIRKCVKPTVKSKKNIAKIRPLKNSDLVPQIQHITRPLATKPIYPASTSKTASSPVLSLQHCTTVTTNTTTTIRISQELDTNCSVFDNSSLLRIVDHNYHQRSLINSLCSEQYRAQTPQNVILTTITPPGESRQLSLEQNNSQSAPKLSPITELNTQASSRSIRPRNSVNKDNNDKVNNNPLTHRTNNNHNNLVASVSPISHHPYRFVHKECLYRHLLKFHYIKKLTSQHISEYLLPSLEIGKSYMEATIVSEHFKTRLNNKSISSIFRYWPKKVQQDFLLVLKDLNEFHYVSFQRNSLKSHDDLRVRILYWLLTTAPSFAHCQFIFEGNNMEFARCETVHNGNNISYKRKPFTNLTKALDTKLLNRIKDLKRKS